MTLLTIQSVLSEMAFAVLALGFFLGFFGGWGLCCQWLFDFAERKLCGTKKGPSEEGPELSLTSRPKT